MKRIVFLCVALIGGTIAQTQQAAEWRPSIAEDNKAATWDATKAFIDQNLPSILNGPIEIVASPRCQISYAGPAGKEYGSERHWKLGLSWRLAKGTNFAAVDIEPGSFAESLGIKPGTELKKINGVSWYPTWEKRNAILGALRPGDTVTFVLRETGEPERTVSRTLTDQYSSGDPNPTFRNINQAVEGWEERRSMPTKEITMIDMSKVDPLSIAIVLSALKIGSGINGHAVQVKVDSSITAQNSVQARPCPASEHCTETIEDKSAVSLLTKGDIELDRRLARALLHASLLCGGTRAVSPF